MATFIEELGFFTRWLSIVAIGAPAGAVLSCAAAYRFARRQGTSLEFTDALLFATAGGLFAPSFATAWAIAIGALGPDVATFSRAVDVLMATAIAGLVFGLAVGVPLGFLAARASVRRAPPLYPGNRRQN